MAFVGPRCRHQNEALEGRFRCNKFAEVLRFNYNRGVEDERMPEQDGRGKNAATGW